MNMWLLSSEERRSILGKNPKVGGTPPKLRRAISMRILFGWEFDIFQLESLFVVNLAVAKMGTIAETRSR